jgi:hypothetical protein
MNSLCEQGENVAVGEFVGFIEFLEFGADLLPESQSREAARRGDDDENQSAPGEANTQTARDLLTYAATILVCAV